MIQEIFFISLGAFLIYYAYSSYISAREESLLRTMTLIAESGTMGEAIESSIERVSQMHGEKSSGIFSRVLGSIKRGKTFNEAVLEVSKSTDSAVLKYIREVIIRTQETGVDTYPVLSAYLKKISKMKYYERYAKHALYPQILVIQLSGVIIIPGIFYFIPILFMGEIVLDSFIFNFFAAMAGIIALQDTFIFEDWISTIIYIPLFSSLALLMPKVMAYIVGLV